MSNKSERRSNCICILRWFVPILPQLLWILLAAVAFFNFKSPLSDLLSRTNKLKIAGLELEASEAIKRSASRLPKEFRTDTTDIQELRIRTKWISLHEESRRYRILVAHDVFSEARSVQNALRDLEFETDMALCPVDIEKMLKQYLYDAVVSDVNWDDCPGKPSEKSNGVKFLSYAQSKEFARPTVFFVANYKPELGVPDGAYGISNNWYDVLESLFAALLEGKRRSSD